jgi:predicted nucleotidyltransferase
MPKIDLSHLQLKAQHLQQVQQVLQTHVPDAEVWAYGSRVNGTAQECSDLDVVLRHAQDDSRDVDGWFELKEALQDSTLPILVEVHLWPRLPASFHANIEKNYVVLQTGRHEPQPKTATQGERDEG